MALRMTGMFSGLDTQSIIQELVAARQTKVDKQKKAQTALSWKQDAWKELNTKLKNLMNKTLGNLRFVSSYSKKTTKVSDSNVASVITGENAVNGVQSLQVKQMAKTAYLTGAEIKGKGGQELTALSKLSDIAGFEGEGGTFTIKAGNKSVDVKVTADTTISDVLNELKNAGLNASFDAKNGRMFISAKESGEANDFSIVASDEGGVKALSALGILTDDKATRAEYQKWAAYYSTDGKDATLANMASMINATVDSRTNSYLDQYKSAKAAADAAEATIKDLKAKNLKSVEDYQKDIEDKAKEIEKLQEEMKDTSLSPEQMREKEEQLLELQKEMTTLNADKADAENLKAQEENLAAYQEQMKSISEYVTVSESVDGEGNVTYSAVATAKLTEEVKDSYYQKAQYAAKVVGGGFAELQSGATKIDGQDSIIYLNGAEFRDTDNTFEINGLTITVQRETAGAGQPGGETITITTDDDTDGIYDMIKSFLKEYNEIVNEMDKLYNADSAGSYEPLTDEEKEALSESEIEKYEQKIKDSLLRRDDNLNTVNSALQSIMAGGVTVNGKTMHLYDFGIDLLGYFNSADNEKHAYHIDGDSDDEYTSGNADKLKSMISNDPDTVISFFSQLSRNLYSKMDELSKSRDNYRSYGNFYDDKKMQSEYNEYTTKIAELEAKLADYEDMWYKKFSKMETALAKMQSNASAVTSLLGGL